MLAFKMLILYYLRENRADILILKNHILLALSFVVEGGIGVVVVEP